MQNMRVRFAPSPTGPLHIGGVRTALYNYLLAKKHEGAFILRIEDTDQRRYVAGAEKYIVESLRWLGIVPDEGPIQGGNFGPYRQSERKDLYQRYVKVLLDSGKAYVAFDTPEELDAMRTRLRNSGVAAPKYDHHVRNEMRNSLTLTKDQTKELILQGIPYVVRLKVDPGRTVGFMDIVRGKVEFQSYTLDDKVLSKADGLPTYHLANIVDDHTMQISHVIRGEEWLSSTAHHVMLYEALGWTDTMPMFAHLPLILKPTGKGKLSKRDGQKLGIPVFPLNWNGDESFVGFREKGFLPAAVLNFLAFLGWNPGTEQELFDLHELVQVFDLKQVQKSGARFDYDKAKWFNQQHIMQSSNEELSAQFELWKPDGIEASPDYILQAVELMKPRIETMDSFWSDAHYLFGPPQHFDAKLLAKKYKPENKVHFEEIKKLVLERVLSNEQEYADSVKGYIKEHNLKFGEILPILRLAIAGTLQGPDLFAMMSLLGPHEVASRIDKLLKKV